MKPAKKARKRRPVCYAIEQQGLAEYVEFALTKKEALRLADDCLWWSPKVKVTPLYAGKPIKWASERKIAKRTRGEFYGTK